MAEGSADLPPSYDEVMHGKTPPGSPRSDHSTARAESVATLPTISESEEDAEDSDNEGNGDDRRSQTSTVVDETAEGQDRNESSTTASQPGPVGGARRVRRVTIGESETIEIDPTEATTPRGSRIYPLEQFMTDNPYKYLSLRHGWTPTPPCPHEEQEDEDDVDAPTKRRLLATIMLFAFISILIFVIAKLLEGARHAVPAEMRPND
uniref:Transmembrane protein n=1 Tax=Steinernema glaseri TaxID=37863 RepID=A0A1I7YQV3_9BILA